MQKEWVQSKAAKDKYIVVNLTWILILFILILASPVISIVITFLLVVFLIISIPGTLMTVLINFPSFFEKINLQEKIILHESYLEIVNGTKSTKLSYKDINSMASLLYGVFDYSVIYEISDGKNKYYIPSTYNNRSTLLKEIITRANLKTKSETPRSIFQAQFFWNRKKGFFRTWNKSTTPITDEDTKLDSRVTNQLRNLIIGWGIFIAIIIFVILRARFLN